MPKLRSLCLAFAAALICAGAPAQALTSWTLLLTATDWDEPIFTLTNTSTAGEEIVDLSISIGNPFYNFDQVLGIDPSEATTGATLLSPDRIANNGWAAGGRSNRLVFGFTDFQPGEALTFAVDIDHDLAIFGSNEDARTVLFSNDWWIFTMPNARVSAAFSDGSLASLVLPDGTGSSFSFASDPAASPAAVPELRIQLLLGIGLVGLAWFGEPRRPAGP